MSICGSPAAPTVVSHESVLFAVAVSLAAVVAVTRLVRVPEPVSVTRPVTVMKWIVPVGTSPGRQTRSRPKPAKVKGLVWVTKSTAAGSVSVRSVPVAIAVPVLLRARW